MNKLGQSIGGIVISGTIGQDEYLPRIIYESFGSNTVNVKLMTERRFAVSRGLIIFGFRENGRMVPYLDKVTSRLSQNTPTTEHDHPLSENKTIDFSKVDYVFGLGKILSNHNKMYKLNVYAYIRFRYKLFRSCSC